MKPTLAIVIPCYNEEEVLPLAVETFLSLLSGLVQEEKISSESYLCFVDDGSQDRTWKLVEAYEERSSLIRGIKLSRNFW